MDEATTLAAAAIGSGALGSFVTHILRSRFEDRGHDRSREEEADARRIIDSGAYITELLNQLTTKDERISELLRQGTEQAAEIIDLRSRLNALHITTVPENGASLLEGWLDTLPWPSWVHAVGRNAWHLNRAYCEEFNVPRVSFWQPVNILASWPIDKAREWLNEDLAVVEAGVPREFHGTVPRRVMEPPGPNNPEVPIYVVKRPYLIEDRRYLLGTGWLEHHDERLRESLKLIASQENYSGQALRIA